MHVGRSAAARPWARARPREPSGSGARAARLREARIRSPGGRARGGAFTLQVVHEHAFRRRFRLQSCISGRLQAKVGGASRAGLLRAGAETVNESGAERGGGLAPDLAACGLS